jgi:regulator of sigma E protease
VVGGLEPSSTFAAAGLRPGDRITAIGDRSVNDWTDLDEGLEASLGRRVPISYERDGQAALVEASLPSSMMDLGLHPFVPAKVGHVVPNYPAGSAGLQAGDVIVSVDGTPVRSWWEMSRLISSRPGVPVVVGWRRGPEAMSATITPKADQVGAETVGRIGIGMQIDMEPVSVGRAVTRSGQQLAVFTTSIFGFIHKIVSGEGSGRDLAGPVAIAQMAGENARAGFEPLLTFMALLSVNLAVLNLLPIPMLDGGHLFILLVEVVSRRELSIRQREILQQAGFAFLLLLMVYVTVNDLGRVFGWFG